MKCKYIESAGPYGRGGWIVYTEGSRGITVYKVFATAAQAFAYCGKR